jgi:hypothetical protein
MVEAVVRRSLGAMPEPRDGALLSTELQELNSKAATATMKAVAVAVAGTAEAAVLTLQMQTARSWEVGAAEAALATSLFLQTDTPMLEVVHHRAE